MIQPKSRFKVTFLARALLLANQEIKDSVVGVYPMVAPPNTNGTFITYQRDAYAADTTQMGAQLDGVDFWIGIISDDYDLSLELAEKTYMTLFGDHSWGGYEYTIRLKESNEYPEVSETGTKYIQELLFNAL